MPELYSQPAVNINGLQPQADEQMGRDVMSEAGENPSEEKAQVPNEEVQGRMRDTIQKTVTQYAQLLKPYRERLIEVYKAYSTYKEEKRADWATTFKINKAHEIIEKILPRIVAKNPRWLVSPRLDNFYPDDPLKDENGQPLTDPTTLATSDPNALPLWEAWIKAQDKQMKQTEEFAKGVQDYLTYIFEEYDLGREMRRFAKNMIVYGKGLSKVRYKYEVVNLYQGKEKGSTEDVSGEYPTIDVKSFADVLWDPRYSSMRDMPAVVELLEGVRYGDLERNKERYFNLDKLKEMVELQSSRAAEGDNYDDYKAKLRSIAGLEMVDLSKPIDKNELKLTCYFGYFQEEENGEEKLCEIWMIGCGDQMFFPIYYEYINRIPFVDADCFEDTELNMPVGFVEPMISLQDELNFKKNSASEYVNQALNRSWLWSPNSGVDPRDLESRPNGIITTTLSVADAKANLEELKHNSIDPAYFQEQNDFERQIQSATFTVDTSNPRSQQALTNTATGIRVAFFESNSVIDEVRKHWEAAMVRLAYQLLEETFENMEDNIVLKKIGQAGYWEMNKELLRNAIMRYTIKVEANSSSFDDIENRRDDAIAFWNIIKDAQKSGVNLNLEEAFREVINTFEKKEPNRFLKPKNIQQIVADLTGQAPAQTGQPTGTAVQGPPGASTPAADLTQQVAQGDITSAIPQ